MCALDFFPFLSFMTLSEADLYKFNYSSRLLTLIRRTTKEDLLDLAKQWFEHDELRPLQQSRTWDDYEALKKAHKAKVVDQIVFDWPDGLYAVQAAQLDLKCTIVLNVRKYMLRLTRYFRCYEAH